MRRPALHLSLALLAQLAVGCAEPPPAVAPTPPIVASSKPEAPPPPELPRPTAEDKARVVETPESVIKALRAYRLERPETEQPLREAARAAARMNLVAARGPLLDAFLALRISELKREPDLYRDVSDAMVTLADPAWEPQLIERLTHPIADRTDIPRLRDEVVWQTISSLILGNLRSSNAVRPLLAVTLSPLKIDMASTAVNALIKIGKPAIGPATALLRSEDAELVGYSKSEHLRTQVGAQSGPAREFAESAHVGIAALVLASIGREESGPALIEVMGKSNPLSRAIIARELPKLPSTPANVKAFQAAYEKTPLLLTLPTGLGARESILEAAASFFDPSLVPWLVKSALTMKGESEDLDAIREATLISVLKLMKADQTVEVNRLLAVTAPGTDGRPTTLGKAFAKEVTMAKSLLDACKDDVDCYFARLVDPASQAPATQFQGLKAAYMIGSLGGPASRQRLLDSLPKIDNAAIRYVVGLAIDHLSPRGDVALADALQGIVDAGEASKDASRIMGNSPFKTVIYRLRSRAQ